MDKPPEKADASANAPPAKAPYKAPVLRNLGTLAELTNALGGSGHADGAPRKSTFKRTH